MLERTQFFSNWAWAWACGSCRYGENVHLSCQRALDISRWLEGDNFGFDHLVALRDFAYKNQSHKHWSSIHARLEHWVEEIEGWC